MRATADHCDTSPRCSLAWCGRRERGWTRRVPVQGTTVAASVELQRGNPLEGARKGSVSGLQVVEVGGDNVARSFLQDATAISRTGL